MKLVIEKYGRRDDTLEAFLDRIEAAGYYRAHAVAYIQYGVIRALMSLGLVGLR